MPTGSEFRVNTQAAGDQYGSTITALADGGYVVAWAGSQAPGGKLYDIFAQRYDVNGAAVGVQVPVNTNAAGFQRGPTVTGLKDGGYIVSWLGPGTESPDVVARRYDLNGAAVSGEIRISTIDAFHDLPTMTALADGGFVAAWIGIGTGGLGIRARLFGADGTPAGDEFLVAGTASGSQGGPSVTALGHGGFVVTWTSPGGGGPDIHGQIYTANGTPAGGEFRVNTATVGDQLRPAVTALADGGFVVTWVGAEVAGANNYDVLARRYGVDGAAGAEFRVNTAVRADQNGAVDVTNLSDGGFLVSWSGIGVDGADVFAQRYLANGAAAGPEFRINANAAGYEYGPSVVGLASGGFAVSWSDKAVGAATPDTDVHLQRFTFPAPVSAAKVVANAPQVAEGNAGATVFTFTVTLDTAVGTAQTVDWRVQGAGPDPAAASDFAGGALPSGMLAFAANETTKTITVTVAGDTAPEWTEAFAVVLSNPSAGVGIATADAAGWIVDDDLTLVRGTDGDDTFAGTPGRFAYDGLQAHDRLHREDIGFRIADVAAQADGSALLTHGGEAALTRGVEEVLFLDGRLVLNPYDPAAKVTRLYEAALDRPPDQGGLNFWIGALQNGEPLSSLASGFLSAPEFTARFGDIADNGAFVDRLYLNVLGRAGEAEGRAFWANGLNGGATRADVLTAFSESAENQAGTALLVQNGIWDRSEAAAQVARIYDTVLGRRPDIQGLTFWKGALEDGAASREQMADAFTGSAEFRAQYGVLGNRDFANALYVNTLDRPADQAGLDFWTGALDAGTARSAVVLAFSESAEHVALTAPTIGGENPAEFGILFA